MRKHERLPTAVTTTAASAMDETVPTNLLQVVHGMFCGMPIWSNVSGSKMRRIFLETSQKNTICCHSMNKP